MNNEKLYTPSETAKKLGVSMWTLRQMRQMGRIEGTFLGNTTLYTQEQIDNATLPRPKKSKKNSTTTQGDDPDLTPRICA